MELLERSLAAGGGGSINHTRKTTILLAFIPIRIESWGDVMVARFG